jgi:hypothetical protein
MEAKASALSFSIDGVSQPVLLPAPNTGPDILPAVHFAFRDRDRPGLTHVAFHCADSLQLLQGVRRGEREIVDCVYPAGIRGFLQWKSAQDVDWRSFDLPAGDSGSAVSRAPPEVIANINEIIRARTSAVQFSFGPFGEFVAAAETAPAGHATVLILPKPLRARILWLCKQSGTYADRHRTPLDRLPDQDLAKLFLALTVAPALASQKRATERGLLAISCAMGLT